MVAPGHNGSLAEQGAATKTRTTTRNWHLIIIMVTVTALNHSPSVRTAIA